MNNLDIFQPNYRNVNTIAGIPVIHNAQLCIEGNAALFSTVKLNQRFLNVPHAYFYAFRPRVPPSAFRENPRIVRSTHCSDIREIFLSYHTVYNIALNRSPTIIIITITITTIIIIKEKKEERYSRKKRRLVRR